MNRVRHVSRRTLIFEARIRSYLLDNGSIDKALD